MPRDPKRIMQVITLLGEYWTLNSETMDLRLGQIIQNANGASELSVFHLEDERLIERLEKMIEYAREKHAEYGDERGDERPIDHSDSDRGVEF